MNNGITKGIIMGGIVGAIVGIAANEGMVKGRNSRKLFRTGKHMMRSTNRMLGEVINWMRH